MWESIAEAGYCFPGQLPAAAFALTMIDLYVTCSIACGMSIDHGNEDSVARNPCRQTIPIIPIFPLEFRLCRKNSNNSNTLLILVVMLPPSYTKAVLAEYQRKLLENELPIGMRELTPSGFREACLAVRRKGYDKKDEPILIGFFGEGSNLENCLRAIGKRDLAKFKPVIKFCTEGTQKPNGKVVELLAWLIDFNPRPYNPIYNYDTIPSPVPASPQGLSEDNKAEISPIEHDPQNPTPTSIIEEVEKNGEKKEKKKKKFILAITITIAFGMTIFLLWPNKSVPIYIGHQSCMFWNETHYQPISCQPHGDTLVVPLDSNRLTHFQKITRPDTITISSLGSIWYVRYRKDYEFYTGNGSHPLDPNLRLRPITDYIIRNHIHSKP